MRTDAGLFFIAVALVVWDCASAANLCPQAECVRLPSIADFGPTANLHRLYVDIGTCSIVKNCSSDVDSTNYNSSDVYADCSFPPRCTPDSFERKSFSNRSGPFLVTTIGSCRMLRNASCGDCRRWPKPMTVLPGSGYARVVDVGGCEGKCSGTNQECVPTVNFSVAVNGPNGALLIDQIKECGCQDNRCYRQSYFESHLELKVGNNGSVEAVHKLIDVGRCVGACAGIMLESICYPSPDLCWLRTAPQKSTCAPAFFFDVHLHWT
ncbi:hypothetical protein EMCRGX_G022741 [Ephydatia muelleri]